ncbi:30S ribosomal protein S7 [Candidatus Woesearchaeota archaeon]|jgi:small subunit ribosomal protein S7|nr:30S ribosomal protein S7 [Candidatus Woesearchaeota archaeon]MBT6045104.1 30S ribosomal protein S7 [Candidatus Woesearchaeota archaeon]
MKLFNLWDTQGIILTDMSLKNVITTTPQLVAKSQGRNAAQRFYRNRNNIVERLITRLMVPGHKGKKHFKSSGSCSGKYLTTAKIAIKTLKILEERTKENPVQVLVTAVENAAPREEITTVEYGGARYPQAVDCSPLRRIDIALRIMIQGSYQKSFGKKVKMESALADEILAAYNFDQKSAAISKKLEMERMADAAR